MQKAFTIVEILVTITIIVIISALAITSYSGISNRATLSSIKSNLTNTSRALKLDQVSNSKYPETLSEVNNNKGIKIDDSFSTNYATNNNSSPQGFCLSFSKNNLTYSIDENDIISQKNCNDLNLVLSIDAGNLDSYPANGTLWHDLSENSHTCVLNNGATYNAESGGSIFFDGVDDNVNCGYLNPMTYYTISTWFKPVSLGNGDTIFSTTSYYGVWVTAEPSGEIYARSFSNNTAGNSTLGASINTTKWSLVTISSSQNGSAKVYIDGIIKGTFLAGDYSWSGNFSIGDLRPNRYLNLNGLISTTTVHNRIMSDEEVLNIYNNQKNRYGL